MGAQLFHQTRRQSMTCAALCGLVLILVSMGVSQTRQPAESKQTPVASGPEQFTRLAEQLGPFLERLQREVKFPPARTESRLLPLLPEGTTFYVALPNYGDAAHQALGIFKQELQNNAALSEWWHSAGATAPKVEDYIERFYLLSQYLGDEIVLAGAVEGDKSKFFLIAEVRNPGLKVFLQQALKQAGGKASTGIRVLDPQELVAAKEPASQEKEEPVLLVRPDLVVGALDLATLRSFNAALDSGRRDFLSSPFGQRLARSYDGSVTLLGGADLQRIVSRIPQGTDQSKAILQSTGFADVKYAVWEHKSVAGQDVSQMELSFIGPRHGIASWLGAPTTLGSLEFVSPKPMMVASVVLTSPARMFDDIQQLATASNPNAFANLAQFEQALQLSLKNDLLAQLGGEITLELDSITPTPAWKAILRVNDPNRLQQTLSGLLAAAHFTATQSVEGGVTYQAVRIPSGKITVEIEYAFVDGYLIIGSSHAAVANAIRLHSTGESLGKSSEFAASLPPGHGSGVSAIWYQDPIAMAALRLQQVAPGMAATLTQSGAERKPVVMCLYGEETAIRQASTAPAADAGVVLAIAAIAIPNLLRSRVAANEASAVGTLRSVVTAQITYQATYPARGYAPSLAALGSGPNGSRNVSAGHAGLLADPPAGASCAAGVWCTKSGYRFTVTASCKLQRCREFVVVATPVTANSTGVRSFCSTSDGVIRFKAGEPPTAPMTAAQCRQWAPLQ